MSNINNTVVRYITKEAWTSEPHLMGIGGLGHGPWQRVAMVKGNLFGICL